jgi:hypothetical protein
VNHLTHRHQSGSALKHQPRSTSMTRQWPSPLRSHRSPPLVVNCADHTEVALSPVRGSRGRCPLVSDEQGKVGAPRAGSAAGAAVARPDGDLPTGRCPPDTGARIGAPPSGDRQQVGRSTNPPHPDRPRRAPPVRRCQRRRQRPRPQGSTSIYMITNFCMITSIGLQDRRGLVSPRRSATSSLPDGTLGR